MTKLLALSSLGIHSGGLSVEAEAVEAEAETDEEEAEAALGVDVVVR